jgi:hypothetical protein
MRATDEDGKPCKFGFAEYEDPGSLGCAFKVLKDLEIPAVDNLTEGSKLIVRLIPIECCPTTSLANDGGQITIDDKSKTYLENMENPDDADRREFQVDTAKSNIEQTLAEFKDPSKHAPKPVDGTTPAPQEKPTPKPDENTPQPEIVTIPLSADDELSDIPADMREMVAKEIQAFRERSNRRDMERLKREEEIERMERERNNAPSRVNRLASPPPSAPTGPSGGSNAIPIGPSRLRSGTPTAPRVPTAPRDYQKGVSFVNGGAPNGFAYSREEEESDASDSELERRRKERKSAEQEKTFLDHERRWLNRERSRTSALEREKQRDEDDRRREEAERATMAKRLAEWDDDVEAENKTEEYYADRSVWTRNRSIFRQREIEHDERDRANELRQAEADTDRKRAAESMADMFLAQQAAEMEKAAAAAKEEPRRFKLSLGAAAASRKTEEKPRRKTAADVENLLEDEEEDESKTRRVLIPIQYDASSAMDEETRERLVRQLAQEIPTERKGLFEWKVQWDQVDEAIVKEKLQPFVEKKIVEYLGVQEQELVGFVLGHIRKRGSAEELVKELEMVSNSSPNAVILGNC